MAGWRRVAGALALGLAWTAPAGAEEGTLEAFASWTARGQVYPTGPQEVSFVGVLAGVLYVRGADGSFDSGLMSCPGTLVTDTESGGQSGTGKCVILTPDGERVFAAFNCAGTFSEGCNGDFRLTGGSGSKAMITGGGEVQFRSALGGLVAAPGNVVEQEAVGMAFWPSLTYRLP